MHDFLNERIAGLECLVSRRAENRLAILLLHGYGADFNDLCSLASELDASKSFDWYFLRAPLRLPMEYGYEGRAWFPIDMLNLQMALHREETLPFAELLPEGLISASASVQAFAQQLAVNYEGLILGGFSQGAMVSCDAALQLIKPPLALIQLSSNLLAKTRWKERMPIAKSIKIFQAHGRQDPVLPFTGAESMVSLWEKYSFQVQFTAFNGGHEIPGPILQELRKFLQSLRKP